jgi:serine phosphatase RsbU (regulator of sigma subunit)
LEDLQQRSLDSIMDEYIVRDDQGRPLTMSDVPSVKLLEGREAEPLILHTVHRQTGEARWQRLKTAPLRDAEGQTVAAVTVIEDLTAVKTAEVRTRVLANSGRILASSLDYEQTLRNVAQVAVPDLADWCVVELIDPDMRRQPAIVTHSHDDAHQELVEKLRSYEPEVVAPDSTLGRVFRSGRPELLSDMSEEYLASAAQDPERLELYRGLGLRSAVVVPMRVPARTIGVMSFLTAESLRRLTEDDMALAEQLGRRAAVAVENARLHTELRHVARTLQESLLPRELPEVAGWEIASLYRPAGAELPVEIGGDFFEVFAAGPTAFALIGDVTGHGVEAATLTSMLRYGARFASRLEPQPAAILRRLDEELRGRPGTALCTALCARIEDRGLVLCSAGHPPAMIAHANGAVSEVPEPGPLLGAFADADWRQTAVEMSTSRMVLLYTDGVIETARPGERFGVQRLRHLLFEHAGASPAQLLAAVNDALTEFRGAAPHDDIAALALRPAS